jgi:peptidoglycan/LPS O-acetylase OafA/YrhL
MRKHYYWLDLFRFAAALLVVIAHAKSVFIADFENLDTSYQTNRIRFILSIFNQGHMAVLIFFVISGFLVGGKSIQKIINGAFDYKSYAIDRFVRISLPLIGSLVLIFIVNLIIGDNYSVVEYIGNLFSLQEILVRRVSGPLWSLPYEVWCYVLIMGIGLFCRTQKVNINLGAIAILSVFIVYTQLQPIYLFIWLLGALCYFMDGRMKKNNYLIIISVLTLIISDFLLKALFQYDEHLRYFLELIFSISFALLLLQFLQITPTSKWSIKINNYGTHMASFSYTLYLSPLCSVEINQLLWS